MKLLSYAHTVLHTHTQVILTTQQILKIQGLVSLELELDQTLKFKKARHIMISLVGLLVLDLVITN